LKPQFSRPITLGCSVNELIVGVEYYFVAVAAIEPRERRKEEKPVNADVWRRRTPVQMFSALSLPRL
jgi:hypothetical protein